MQALFSLANSRRERGLEGFRRGNPKRTGRLLDSEQRFPLKLGAEFLALRFALLPAVANPAMCPHHSGQSGQAEEKYCGDVQHLALLYYS